MFLAVKTLCLLLIVSAFIICPCYKKRKKTQEQTRIAPLSTSRRNKPILSTSRQDKRDPRRNPSVAVPEPEWSEQSDPLAARPIAAEEEAISTSGSSSSSGSISTAKQIGENDQDAPGDPTKQQPATEEETIDNEAGRGDYETCCAIL